MKIVRYQNPSGQIEFGTLDNAGKVFKLRGDIFDKPEVTKEIVMLLHDDDTHARASKQISAHDSGRPAAGDDAAGLGWKRHGG